MINNPVQVFGSLLLIFAAGLAVALVVDLMAEIEGSPPVGRRLNRWARRSPVLVCALFAVWGGFLSHFFWQWNS